MNTAEYHSSVGDIYTSAAGSSVNATNGQVIFRRYPMINQFIVYWSCANGIETEWLIMDAAKKSFDFFILMKSLIIFSLIFEVE